ncbi:hypothetical protein EYF80_018090 [Liparis tanakae]|uniref:Uncharacterized protein n=1 Tax=Liparis tanakae TaxID=230148 RepID=A0A4Z2I0V7_9TELE|nr:hypothetical protein EYF80_018090 [Liparis tanakae]
MISLPGACLSSEGPFFPPDAVATLPLPPPQPRQRAEQEETRRTPRMFPGADRTIARGARHFTRGETSTVHDASVGFGLRIPPGGLLAAVSIGFSPPQHSYSKQAADSQFCLGPETVIHLRGPGGALRGEAST